MQHLVNETELCWTPNTTEQEVCHLEKATVEKGGGGERRGSASFYIPCTNTNQRHLSLRGTHVKLLIGKYICKRVKEYVTICLFAQCRMNKHIWLSTTPSSCTPQLHNSSIKFQENYRTQLRKKHVPSAAPCTMENHCLLELQKCYNSIITVLQLKYFSIFLFRLFYLLCFFNLHFSIFCAKNLRQN